MRRITLVMFSMIGILSIGCTKKAEWKLLSKTEKAEVQRHVDGSEEKQRVLEIAIDCPSQFPGPVKLAVVIKDIRGNLLVDVMPSFGVSDTEKQRKVYLFIREADIKQYPYSVLSATIASDGFPPIHVEHQFKEDGA